GARRTGRAGASAAGSRRSSGFELQPRRKLLPRNSLQQPLIGIELLHSSNQPARLFPSPSRIRKGLEQSTTWPEAFVATPCSATDCGCLSRAHFVREFEERPSRGAFTFSRVCLATS